MLKNIYLKWLISTKNIIALIGLAFINDVIINKMFNVYMQTNQPFCILESGIMLSNSGLIVMMLSVIFILLMSDFPDASAAFYFQQIRAGRKEWFFKQIIFSVLSVITYLTIMFGFVMIRTQGISYVANGWSLNVTDYGKEQGLISYVPLQLFNQMTPLKAFVFSMCILFLYLNLINSIQLFGFAYGKKKSALVFNIIMLVVGVCASFFKSNLMWFLPFSHSILWLHYDKYMKTSDIGTYGSAIFLLVLTIILNVAAYRHFVNSDIDQMKEEMIL